MSKPDIFDDVKNASTVMLVIGSFVLCGMSIAGMYLVYSCFFVQEGFFRFIEGTLALFIAPSFGFCGLICLLQVIARWRLKRTLDEMSRPQTKNPEPGP